MGCAWTQGEMRQGLGYFHETIFPALPAFYRRIDTALKQACPCLCQAPPCRTCWLHQEPSEDASEKQR